MSNEYGFDIVPVKTYVSIDVLKRIDRLAAAAGKTRSRFIAETLAARVVGVSLSDKDRQEISAYIEEARRLRAEKRKK